jgi:hypothetical protein
VADSIWPHVYAGPQAIPGLNAPRLLTGSARCRIFAADVRAVERSASAQKFQICIPTPGTVPVNDETQHDLP